MSTNEIPIHEKEERRLKEKVSTSQLHNLHLMEDYGSRNIPETESDARLHVIRNKKGCYSFIVCLYFN